MSCDFTRLATGHIAQLHPYKPGKPIEEVEREYGVRNAAKLASNENPLGPSPGVIKTLHEAIQGRALAFYPDGSGYRLKHALAAQLGVDAAQITLGNGSNDVLELIARTFARSTDGIMYAQYAFLVYPIVTQVIGAQAQEIPAHNWGHDLLAMAEALQANTRVIFLANPNNPTGTCFGKNALENFLARIPEDVIVVLDEAYGEYIDDPDYPHSIDYLGSYPNLIITRTFSKAYGLAGLRVGYALSSVAIADLLNRIRQPFNVTSLGLLAAEIALQDHTHLQQCVALNRAGLRQLSAGFSALGLDYIPSSANFICVDMRRNGLEVYEALLHHGVIVRPVNNYALPTHLRISVGTEEENARCLAALKKVLHD
jgi:histidinol-phosphate aminotransferase